MSDDTGLSVGSVVNAITGKLAGEITGQVARRASNSRLAIAIRDQFGLGWEHPQMLDIFSESVTRAHSESNIKLENLKLFLNKSSNRIKILEYILEPVEPSLIDSRDPEKLLAEFDIQGLALDLQQKSQLMSFIVKLHHKIHEVTQRKFSPEVRLIIKKLDKREILKSRWNSYIRFHCAEGSAYFELEDISDSLGVAEPEDTGQQEIFIGQGFRLKYQLPFAGHALLLQGIKDSWTAVRLGSKCKDATLSKEARYIKERTAYVASGEWSVPTHGVFFREETDPGLHRFVLLLAENPFPERIHKSIIEETDELSFSTLNEILDYLESTVFSMAITAECNIVKKT